MSFETFSAKVINKIGFEIQIKFYSEEEKHTAVIPGGKITKKRSISSVFLFHICFKSVYGHTHG